jgi:flavin reductase (DIM6/NTAB) family NADH-FMN oxidoreductase RutF
MSKIIWKPGTLVYPVPAVMVSCGNMEESNILTVAWTGTICTDPPMTYISIRPERHSYNLIKNSGEFVINLTTQNLAYATDMAGVKSGENINKFDELKLTKEKASIVSCPIIKESPVNIECKVKEIKELGSHHMFIAEVVAVDVDDSYMGPDGRFEMEKCNLIAYSHGQYYGLGENLGKFGYSVKK